MKKIIIIDDDPAIQDSVSLIFKRNEYEVTTYPDGANILSGNFVVPDIFIIDKQLPGVDGLSICTHLKQQSATEKVPVLIMSASTDTGKLATQAGADGFIEKPYSIQQLRTKVVSHLL